MSNDAQDIFQFVDTQEKLYKENIQLPGGWDWNMKDHIDTSFLYIHSQLKTGKDDFKPVKNITRPIINLQKRTEDIEVKDVQLYVDDPAQFHLSFLVKKYHDDVFVVENDLDTYFDDLNASRIEYGGGLSKKLNKACPEVAPLHTLAFGDQTDLLSGPLGFRHHYAPDQLLAMKEFGWGNHENGADVELEDLIAIAEDAKKEPQNDTDSKTPGRYVEVLEVYGCLPGHWLDNEEEGYPLQMHIIASCTKGDKKHNYTLFKTKLKELPLKLVKRDPVYGRALGFGGAEELFESQVWTTYDMIRKQAMLDAAAVTIFKTTDPNVAGRNKIRDMDNLDIIELADDTDLSQVDTFPRNMRLFDQSMQEWESHAQTMGSASDASMGESPATNTPFKLQDLVVRQNNGLHEWRRGQFARHIEEIYTHWIIPHIAKEICKGTRFLSELSLEDMQYLTDAVVTKQVNKQLIDMVIAGEEVTEEHKEMLGQVIREEFKKKGNKHFLKILKGEFKNAPLRVKVSVRSKSKDLGGRVDNLTNVFRQVIANPGVLSLPPVARIFNDILEYSGLDPADFTGLTKQQLAAAQAPGQLPGTEQPVAPQPI